MFERFTDPAREVVILAQDEARALGHNHIGTEHVLLGLLRQEDGIAASVLESLHVTIDEVRAQVERIPGQGEDVTTGRMPFSPRTKKVLELSLREALALGHNHIGPEHILIGVAREGEGVAARILLEYGADTGKIVDEVMARHGGPSRQGDTRPESMRPRRMPRWEHLVEQTGALEKIWLDELGADGWELVSIVPGSAGGLLAVFKRPLSPL
jgi:ATP-dependent Clp protease ATP-binding subunit ClpC